MAKPKVSIITSCFNGEDYLSSYFENVVAQANFAEIEIVFLHNAPKVAETKIINSFVERFPDQLKYITINPVEPLGASWNRGWRSARGEYIAIWNIDDRRVPDSLARQIKTLVDFQDCALTYGDYIITSRSEYPHGRYVTTPNFNRASFLRDFHAGGAFLLFRKEVSEKIGFFDEQLRIALDFEYITRMAFFGLKMMRTEGLLGYFTDENIGLSTREGARPTMIEVTAIQLRYGIFDKIKKEFLVETSKFEISRARFFDEWYPIQSLLPGYNNFIKSRQWLWIFGNVRNFLRFVFLKIGIWKIYLKLRTALKVN
jgi:glycosyltransferase involved in cell wall biosynthesis